jgi:hypothetical protein
MYACMFVHLYAFGKNNENMKEDESTGKIIVRIEN